MAGVAGEHPRSLVWVNAVGGMGMEEHEDLGGPPAADVLSYVFWCGLFGKVVADGATGGILNRTVGVGSG